MKSYSNQEVESKCRTEQPERETDPLRIPELLISVFELLDSSSQSIVAQVCRRWSEPALDLLWAELSDVAPLLKLLLTINMDSRMSLEEKQDRLELYASRVRTLRFDMNNTKIYVSEGNAVLQALLRDNPEAVLPNLSISTSGLLPSLRTLVWKSCTQASQTFNGISYFLVPTLENLLVSGWHASMEYGPLLGALTEMEGLGLRSLDLTQGYDSTEPEAEAIPCLLQHADTLAHLRLWTDKLVGPVQNVLPLLSQLRSIDIATYDIPEVVEFIEALAATTPEMESVKLAFLSEADDGEMQRIWSALKKLPALKSLHINTPEVRELDDGAVHSMAEAWPQLSVLYIVQSASRNRWRSGLSINALNSVALYFSKTLRELGLHILPDIPSSSSMCSRFQRLKILHFAGSPLPRDQTQFVTSLAQILPRGVIIKSKWRGNWDEIRVMLEKELEKALVH